MENLESKPQYESAERAAILSPENLLLRGSRYQYLALNSTDPEEALQCHTQAIEDFKTAKSRTDGKGDTDSRIANMIASCSIDLDGIVRPLIVEHRMPELDEVNQASRKIVNSFFRLMNKNGSPKLGRVYESVAVLSLLHYWQVNILQAEDWLAVLSFVSVPLSDSYSIDDRESEGHLSVYSDYDGAVRRIYKIHVGDYTGEPPRSSESTEEDLPLTILSFNDLKLEDGSISAKRIITDLYQKRYKSCDKMAEIVIERLG